MTKLEDLENQREKGMGGERGGGGGERGREKQRGRETL